MVQKEIITYGGWESPRCGFAFICPKANGEEPSNYDAGPSHNPEKPKNGRPKVEAPENHKICKPDKSNLQNDPTAQRIQAQIVKDQGHIEVLETSTCNPQKEKASSSYS